MSHVTRRIGLMLAAILLFGIGTAAAVHATVYYVNPSGNDSNNGQNWATARQTVQAAMNLTASGDEVWVQQGTYTLKSAITMTNGAGLYGGFNGTETALSQRDPSSYITILDGNQVTTVVSVNGASSTLTRIDGFAIRNSPFAAVYCSGSATVVNNTITGNAGGIYFGAGTGIIGSNVISGNGPTSYNGAGISCSTSSSLITHNTISGNITGGDGGGILVVGMNNVIADNLVEGNSAGAAGGIYDGGSNDVITGNTITGNVSGTGGGIYLGNSTGVFLVADNFLTKNSASGDGGGIYDNGSPAIIKDNLIVGNSANATGASGHGGGIRLGGVTSNGSVIVANNTFDQNTAGAAGGGLYTDGPSSTTYSTQIANNILTQNSTGIAYGGSGDNPILVTNDVYGNTSGNYVGVSAGPTDISVDPKFLDRQDDDYHLADGSACIDIGTDSFIASGDTDLDGNPRIYGAHVDLGCYEWIPSPYPDLASISVGALCGGTTAVGTISLTGNALANGSVATLASSSPNLVSVPTTITVPAGNSNAPFSLTVANTALPFTVTITATYRGITMSVTAQIVPILKSLTISPAALISGGSATGTINLNCPAPPGGMTVTLTNPSQYLSMPATVFINTGATSAPFTIHTAFVTQMTPITVTATFGGQSVNGTITLDPSGTLKAIAVAPTTVTGGLNAIGVVTLTAAAPTGGIAVAVASNNGAATPPASVVVPAGKRSVQFLIATSAVTGSTPVTLSATLGGVTKTTKLTVTPAAIASLTLIPSTVQGTENSIGVVQLAAPASSPVTVTLASSNSLIGSPDVTSIVIPAGALQGTFNISTNTVTANSSVVIHATVYGVAKSATLNVTP